MFLSLGEVWGLWTAGQDLFTFHWLRPEPGKGNQWPPVHMLSASIQQLDYIKFSTHSPQTFSVSKPERPGEDKDEKDSP